MSQKQIDTIWVIHDNGIKLVSRDSSLLMIPHNKDTQAISIQNEKLSISIDRVPKSQPMITDWLTSIGTILAVVLSLLFSGLALLQKRRKNFVKIKSVSINGVGYPDLRTIQLHATVINNSSVMLEINELWFQYNRQRGPLYPVFFRPVDKKVIIPPLNSKRITFDAYKFDIPCNSFLEMAQETVGYLQQYQDVVKNRLKVDKRSFKKVLMNLNVGIKSNLDTERYFMRKLTRTETKYCTSQILKIIDKVSP